MTRFNQPLKIIQIVPQLGSGGAERFVVDLSNELLNNHDVTLITFFPLETHGFYKDILSDRVKIISLNKKLGKDLMLPFKLLKQIRSHRPHIVHTHLNAFFYSLLCILFIRKKTKYIHTVHNDALKEAPNRKGLLIKRVIFKRRLSLPITISQLSSESFTHNYGFTAGIVENGRADESMNPIDPNIKDWINSLRQTTDTKIFVNIARLAPEKNHKLLIDSFKLLIPKYPNIKLLIIGSELDSNIGNYVRQNVNDKIHYLGEQTRPIDFLKLSDAFCLSSTIEGMPISIIEALSVGCVPICTPAGGIPNMIEDGRSGILSEGFTTDHYVSALERRLEMTNDKYHEMQIETKKRFTNYSMERCAHNYQTHYKNLLNQNVETQD